LDGTGLKIYGEGEWLDAKQGSRSRRRWRKLHIGINAETLYVVVAELTPDDAANTPRFLICWNRSTAGSRH
jgi:hypothetical protein